MKEGGSSAPRDDGRLPSRDAGILALRLYCEENGARLSSLGDCVEEDVYPLLNSDFRCEGSIGRSNLVYTLNGGCSLERTLRSFFNSKAELYRGRGCPVWLRLIVGGRAPKPMRFWLAPDMACKPALLPLRCCDSILSLGSPLDRVRPGMDPRLAHDLFASSSEIDDSTSDPEPVFPSMSSAALAGNGCGLCSRDEEFSRARDGIAKPFAPLLHIVVPPHVFPVAAGLTMPFVLDFFSVVVVLLAPLNDRACAKGQLRLRHAAS